MNIAEKYLDKLIELRGLVREAVGKSSLLFRHVLKKDGLYVEVFSSIGGVCKECGERVEDNGLTIKIEGERVFRQRKVGFSEEAYFHTYHVREIKDFSEHPKVQNSTQGLFDFGRI